MEGDRVDHRSDTGPGVITITKAGWLFIIITIFLGVSAVNTGNNLLYLIVAAFLGFMGISGFFGRRNLSGLDIRLDLPDEIYAQTDLPLRVTLINRRRFLPAFLIRVRLLDRDVLFPFTDRREEGYRYATIAFRKRGRVRVDRISLCSVFPFNFFVRCRSLSGSFEAVVFPAPKQCDLLSLNERERRQGGETQTDTAGYEADIISLRDYIQGDPIKYIHWKASARTGRLKTKELSSLSRPPVVIDFEAVNIRGIEEKLSCITYAVLRLIRQNIPVGLRMRGDTAGIPASADRDTLQAGKRAILRKLALYGEE